MKGLNLKMWAELNEQLPQERAAQASHSESSHGEPGRGEQDALLIFAPASTSRAKSVKAICSG